MKMVYIPAIYHCRLQSLLESKESTLCKTLFRLPAEAAFKSGRVRRQVSWLSCLKPLRAYQAKFHNRLSPKLAGRHHEFVDQT